MKILAALLLGAAILGFSGVRAFAEDVDAGNSGNGAAVDKFVPGDQQLQIVPAGQ